MDKFLYKSNTSIGLIIKYVLFGGILGLCFPIVAWIIDIKIHNGDFNLQSVAELHEHNPIHWLIDATPVVMIATSYLFINAIIKRGFRDFKILEEERMMVQKEKEDLEMHMENIIQQKNLLDKQKQKILDNINYSRRIQTALMPTKETMQRYFPEYFILSLPKDIVSGDFYWISQSHNSTFLAVGDCTGHGVSGALMSMLGIAFLNEIVNKNKYNNPNDILFELREYIIKYLKQKGKIGETADGLDIALCKLDFDNRYMEYAGANNSVYIVRNKELIELKADRMPIGIYRKDKVKFTNKPFHFEKGDELYLFTDGYADQFGGTKGTKLRYKNFKQLLINQSTQKVDVQKEALCSFLNDWKGDNEQIDDILIMGLKIG
jgi:serine phosphatase RsbU (regulator of sigma subunit)